MIRLSVLDLSMGSGSTPARALGDSLDVAWQVDGLGYRRFRLAEHRALPYDRAGSAPP